VPPLIIVAAGLIAYSNSFGGGFVLDDMLNIVGNPRIQRLWPPWPVLTGSNRPVVELSVAINYALGGLNPWGYHAVNLVVHLLAGLVLFGIVRRTLESGMFQGRQSRTPSWLAAAVATIWVVHPLQTESVTYIIQRAESLMGLFLLLTLYCTIRGAASARPRPWYTAAVCACLLGMGSKEIMASAPILVLVYDRLFLAASFKEVARKRWPLYLGLAATWLLLAVEVLRLTVNRQDWSLVADLTPWRYAITQPAVIAHYLRLALWPHPLVLDYAWRPADALSAALPSIALMLVLLAATVWSLHRKFWAGFWGAWFFLILAPTSSIFPIADLAVEHRMYLPLAAVVVVAVVGGHGVLEALLARWGLPEQGRRWVEALPVVAAVASLGFLTIHRNADYRSPLVMWNDVVAKAPDNPRAQNNLGNVLSSQGRSAEALPHYAEAVRLKPDYVDAQYNLANALSRAGRRDEAVAHYTEVLRLAPAHPEAHNNLGLVLKAQGRVADAIAHYTEALRLKPAFAEAYINLGLALASQGRLGEAIGQYAQAARLRPDLPEAQNDWGVALARQRRFDEARAHFLEALRIRPGYADAYHNLGTALMDQGRLEEALAQYDQALRLNPSLASVHYDAGVALMRLGRMAEATQHFETASRIDPRLRRP
jgi:tetratricopeptide (TPR) repeat protein